MGKHRSHTQSISHSADVEYTHHAASRGAQRNLSSADIEYVIEHGRCDRAYDGVSYFLGDKDIPDADRHNDKITRLIGTTVITDLSEGKVITAWRNRKHGSKHTRCRVR